MPTHILDHNYKNLSISAVCICVTQFLLKISIRQYIFYRIDFHRYDRVFSESIMSLVKMSDDNCCNTGSVYWPNEFKVSVFTARIP